MEISVQIYYEMEEFKFEFKEEFVEPVEEVVDEGTDEDAVVGTDEDSDVGTDEVADNEEMQQSCCEDQWATLEEMAKIFGIEDLRKLGSVQVFPSADPADPGEIEVFFHCSSASYHQLADFWELRFETKFEVQGPRKGKSSSRSQISSDFSMQLHNSFTPLADGGDEPEEVQQVQEIESSCPDAPYKKKVRAPLQEDFEEILREFGWSDGSLVAGGGRGSGRKKKIKQEVKQEVRAKREIPVQIKTEPQEPAASSSSSKIVSAVEIPSSPEVDLFEGAAEADAADVTSPPSKRRSLQDGEEKSVLEWVEIDKTPDSGRKEQMSIGTFF